METIEKIIHIFSGKKPTELQSSPIEADIEWPEEEPPNTVENLTSEDKKTTTISITNSVISVGKELNFAAPIIYSSSCSAKPTVFEPAIHATDKPMSATPPVGEPPDYCSSSHHENQKEQVVIPSKSSSSIHRKGY